MLSMERSKAMMKEIIDILIAALAIATGLPRDTPSRPHRDL
jgi:predicted nucleic acid-binding protein